MVCVKYLQNNYRGEGGGGLIKVCNVLDKIFKADLSERTEPLGDCRAGDSGLGRRLVVGQLQGKAPAEIHDVFWRCPGSFEYGSLQLRFLNFRAAGMGGPL